MTREDSLLDRVSGEEAEEAVNGEGEAEKKALDRASGEMESENGEGEPGSLAGQMAERGVNHFIDEKEVRSDMGSIGDLKKNPARELVKTAGLTVVDGAMGAIGSKSVTQAVAKGSSSAVKKVVNSGLKFAGNKATDALAEGAEKLATNQSKLKEENQSKSKSSLPNLEKLVAGLARQPSGQTTPF